MQSGHGHDHDAVCTVPFSDVAAVNKMRGKMDVSSNRGKELKGSSATTCERVKIFTWCKIQIVLVKQKTSILFENAIYSEQVKRQSSPQTIVLIG
jgi:hypothetical protein